MTARPKSEIDKHIAAVRELQRLTALLEDRDGLATFLQNDSEFRWYLTRTEAEKIADRIRAYLKEQK